MKKEKLRRNVRSISVRQLTKDQAYWSKMYVKVLSKHYCRLVWSTKGRTLLLELRKIGLLSEFFKVVLNRDLCALILLICREIIKITAKYFCEQECVLMNLHERIAWLSAVRLWMFSFLSSRTLPYQCHRWKHPESMAIEIISILQKRWATKN